MTGFAPACNQMQGEKRKIKPAVQGLFSLGFGIALMVGWEFYEFTMDRLYGLNLQNSAFNSESGLIDTMIDLIVGAGGSLTGMFITAFSKAGFFRKGGNKK